MYDNSLVIDIVEEMIEATQKIKSRCSKFSCADDFMVDEQSQIVLDSICMQLIAIGTAVKEIDKVTDKKLLINYPQIEWKSIAGIRDILSHHYFDLNAETVFGVCKEHIDELLSVLYTIETDLRLV